MSEENAYILGTDRDELHRLGLQHQVWSAEALSAWDRAGFTAGDILLDLGCGPGFCTTELAYIVGEQGKVIGVDKSSHYIDFLQHKATAYDLPIEGVALDFDDLVLEPDSLDGVYCRWALAWVGNPNEVLAKVYRALKPGGKLVIQEYYDWSTHQTEPALPGISFAIAQCLRSFKEQIGDVDVGRHIPAYLTQHGMKLVSTRPIAKIARPRDATWQWPKSFYNVYFPKLVTAGYMSTLQMEEAFADVEALEQRQDATLLCPLVIEVIAEK